MTNTELIEAAAEVVHARTVGERLIGDVGAALITGDNSLYRGVCIDTASGTGFCAEASAIAAMVTAGESQIDTIVAVWKDDNGAVVVLPPCGRCREFIRQVDERNLDTTLVLGPDNTLPLRDLLPYHQWPS